MEKRNVLILGAAGRDFHNFNTFYKSKSNFNVKAFTATQIPDIEGRIYPAELAGNLYPQGIPIHREEDLEELILKHKIDICTFSYSDISYKYVMKLAARVNAAGASFTLLGPNDTMIKSHKPVISVCASRTGAGKSQTSRKVIEILMKWGLKVIAIRHPMPYGNLIKQRVQRFASIDDLEKHNCTIEEMEEYEPHITRGNVIYSGIDYEAILRAAEQDPDGCDIIVWDGGNNDFSFYHSDLYITLVDPHRPGDELHYYPGEINLRLADVVIINKVNTAPPLGIKTVEQNIATANPTAEVIHAASPITVDQPEIIHGKRVLVIEDGPTLTHGGMKLGAGTLAGQKYKAKEFVDPRPFLTGSLLETFNDYPEIGNLLPAMGYGDRQIRDLEQTINNTDCEVVIIGTPIDLGRIIKINKPYTRVKYSLEELGNPNLSKVLKRFK